MSSDDDQTKVDSSSDDSEGAWTETEYNEWSRVHRDEWWPTRKLGLDALQSALNYLFLFDSGAIAYTVSMLGGDESLIARHLAAYALGLFAVSLFIVMVLKFVVVLAHASELVAVEYPRETPGRLKQIHDHERRVGIYSNSLYMTLPIVIFMAAGGLTFFLLFARANYLYTKPDVEGAAVPIVQVESAPLEATPTAADE